MEVHCPRCYARRAIFPEDAEPILCYSCRAVLDRTLAHPASKSTLPPRRTWTKRRIFAVTLVSILLSSATLLFFVDGQSFMTFMLAVLASESLGILLVWGGVLVFQSEHEEAEQDRKIGIYQVNVGAGGCALVLVGLAIGLLIPVVIILAVFGIRIP